MYMSVLKLQDINQGKNSANYGIHFENGCIHVVHKRWLKKEERAVFPANGYKLKISVQPNQLREAWHLIEPILLDNLTIFSLKISDFNFLQNRLRKEKVKLIRVKKLFEISEEEIALIQNNKEKIMGSFFQKNPDLMEASLSELAEVFLKAFKRATQPEDKQALKEALITCHLIMIEQASRPINGMQIIIYFSDEHKDIQHIENIKTMYEQVLKVFKDNKIQPGEIPKSDFAIGKEKFFSARFDDAQSKYIPAYHPHALASTKTCLNFPLLRELKDFSEKVSLGNTATLFATNDSKNKAMIQNTTDDAHPEDQENKTQKPKLGP